jgi:molybdenum cofactor biosynthesis enzyme MoaA
MYSFEQFLEDKNKIEYNGALLNLTDQCNCRCKYCDFV